MNWLLWAQLDPVGQIVLLRFSLPLSLSISVFYRTFLVFSLPAGFLTSWGRGHLAASGLVSLTKHIYQRKD